tara:strand:- start:9645 stop:9803 length:159 start_codon:yes stop_codon:yes gene_type:complete
MNRNILLSEKDLEEASKEIARNTWDNWVNDLEDKEQPTCSVDNQEDCEACGS